MGKRIPFNIVVVAAAKAQLNALSAFEKRQVIDAIDANLLFDPLLGTRKRKDLGDLPTGFAYVPPLWELKVGELRVFYDVDQQAAIVNIRSVRRKPPHKTTQEIVQ